MSTKNAALTALLAVLTLYSLWALFAGEIGLRKQQQVFDELEASLDVQISEDSESEFYMEPQISESSDQASEPVPDEILPKAAVPENADRFAGLIGLNPDFAAWICIEGTGISYPVMLSRDEPDYYLRKSFSREASESGTPYIGSGCSLESDNIIVYGHNMKNGTMFSDLPLYEDEDFYRAHPLISFDTLYESSEYEVIAAFRSKVYYQDETDVFRYYDYTGSLSEERFEEYLSEIRAASLYRTDADASYGDKLITLSTCAYHTKNGRFVVVAVKRNI